MSIADDFTQQLTPWMTDDLRDYAAAVGGMFAEAEMWGGDSDDGDGNDGYSIMLDVDLCPIQGLPFLAQWNGERLPAGIGEDAARQWIRDSPNQQRSTLASIARAAQRTLTGSGFVQIVERVFPDGSVDSEGDHFTVYTRANETPDPNVVWLDLLTVIPAEMVVNYETREGGLWSDVAGSYLTWSDVAAANPTWADVANVGASGGSIFTR